MRNTAPTAWRRWRSKPLPLTPDSASYAASTSPIADQSNDNASLSQYRPRYDNDRPLLPFPFFFGR
jgi:hypothetical protein